MINLFGDFNFILEREKLFFLTLNLIFGFLFWGIEMVVLIVKGFLNEFDGVELAIGVASGQVDFAEATDS